MKFHILNYNKARNISYIIICLFFYSVTNIKHYIGKISAEKVKKMQV